MNKARLLMISLVLLTLIGSFLKTLFGTVGLPNVMPAVRDPLLIGLAFYGIGKLDFFSSRKWLIFLAATLTFVFPYLLIAMLEDRALIGLYYIRLYVLPFLFFIGALGILGNSEDIDVRRSLLRFFIYWNNLLFIVAASIYALLQSEPSIRATLFGPDLLPTAWYISGGTWMRMGLPLSGPNTLGLVFALNAFLFFGLLITQKTGLNQLNISTKSVLLAALLAVGGLLLSFSRSSMLLLFVALPLFMMTPGVMTFNKFFTFAFVGTLMLALLAALALFVDETSDGFVTRWIVLNTSFSDPSMLGHFRSIADAMDKLHEYILWGYPKGTVGPKAAIFTGLTNSVENSFLAVLYDMGLPIGVTYSIAVVTLLATGYHNRYQLVLLASFLPPFFLLPYVFEIDVQIYFAFVFLAVGSIFSSSEMERKKNEIHITNSNYRESDNDLRLRDQKKVPVMNFNVV